MKKAKAEIHGEHDERFEGVREALERNLLEGEELGASIAVDLDGQSVVDLWGGFRDTAQTTPWTGDTIVNVWSMTKTVTSLAALVLVERGQIDVRAPVAEYWPEFAQNGKAGVEVRHLLSHTSGVSGWEQPVALGDIYDRESATARLAAQAPWWEPGTASGYHALDYGHLVGEVVRRVSGKPLRRFVAEEIAGPLGADFQIGAREADWDRVADVVPPPPASFDPASLDQNSPMARTFTGPMVSAETANTPNWRQAEIGAVNGHGNARSVMRTLRAVSLGGEADGVRPLSPETIGLIFDEQAEGVDLVLGIPLRWGIGYALANGKTLPYLPERRVCFWGGWGGSMVVMDLDRRLTIAYAMNRMAPDVIGSDRSQAYIEAIYDAIA